MPTIILNEAQYKKFKHCFEKVGFKAVLSKKMSDKKCDKIIKSIRIVGAAISTAVCVVNSMKREEDEMRGNFRKKWKIQK